MREALPTIEAFSTALLDQGAKTETLVTDERGTIVAALPAGLSERPTLTVLSGGPDAELRVMRPLSHGGMGEILLAEQSSLGREVAVKVASPRAHAEAAEAALIIEGRVAGQLEHPNIVPVHIVGTTLDGKPLIVMKRIEGKSWARLLAQRAAPMAGLNADIEILIHVCRALQLAHARGVIHRDIKPANVMVGEFGEVYLLDWGIAAAISDKAPADLPRAKDIMVPCGTPQYMAPEMALPDGSMDARTDVYLVGATLHEVLTGQPPRDDPTASVMLFQAHEGKPPQLPSDVPEELADICKRAMQRDVQDRFASIEDLRLALVAFQQHAAARELADRAKESLDLLELLSGANTDPDQRAQLQTAFTEARFGFAQALRIWPGSRRARYGLTRALTVMVRREIADGHLDGARLLAAELDTVPAELAAELDALAARVASEHERVTQLKRIAHEHDARFAGRERALVITTAGVGWFLTSALFAILTYSETYIVGTGTVTVAMLPIFAILTASLVLVPALRSNRANRAMMSNMYFAAVGVGLVNGIGWWFDLPVIPTFTMGHVALAMTTAALAAQDGRNWLAVVIALLMVPIVAMTPGYHYWVSGVGSAAALLLIAWNWRARSQDGSAD